MRIGELCRLKWINVDLERNIITVNNPEKGSRSRSFKISSKLASMIDSLPRKNERIFGKQNSRIAANSFCALRKSVASKLKNPRFEQIHFHTLRHWKATTEYHKTKDILHVMKMLGHRQIENTLIYTQLIQDGKDDEYHSATASTAEEAKTLIETGFEYVCTCKDIMLFRKRK
jgi:integrase